MSVRQVARNIRTGQHVPDILDCLAQLSNDEVPTPPKLARQMLDILPREIWGQADNRWLDPFCKSGIFLREAAARLLEGLSDQIPAFEQRREHIYKDMLWGTSITEMTGMISRRSLYYSRDASGPASVVKFDREAGNLSFVPAIHEFDANNKCTICGAPADLERGANRENYAYSFIHGTFPTEELQNMKFDVIVGNPPYQIDSDGNTRTMPIYQRFVRQAIAMNPRHVVMITPSRWFGGGLGLDEYRAEMLGDRHLVKIVDYPRLFECFPGVEIKGGVSYFHWNRDHNGDCEVVSVRDGVAGAPMTRSLGEFDVLVRDNEAVPILRKVRARNEKTIDAQVATRVPFGLQANFRGFKEAPFSGSIKVYGNKFIGYADPAVITKNSEWVGDWKVLIPKATDGHGRIPALVMPNPLIAGPGEICTDTYLVVRRAPTQEVADRFARYMATRFARFLVHLRKPTQDNKPSTFAFVPDVPMDRDWTDDDLFARYDLTKAQADFIRSQIRPRSDSDD